MNFSEMLELAIFCLLREWRQLSLEFFTSLAEVGISFERIVDGFNFSWDN